MFASAALRLSLRSPAASCSTPLSLRTSTLSSPCVSSISPSPATASLQSASFFTKSAFPNAKSGPELTDDSESLSGAMFPNFGDFEEEEDDLFGAFDPKFWEEMYARFSREKDPLNEKTPIEEK
eukprot:TRINITY_DN11069_c0_g1_i1.p1 TRINITY_DN11069_c0_g1~~TRINITY_DN11069_c0_g1_i1.p1  ORF type:complete len:145 (-),score=62.66 TRINITY_DN11069_c0_g1_i1:190-561(-)